MQRKNLDFSPVFFVSLTSMMLGVFSLLCFSKPLILSIDSAYGFLAYKSTLIFHCFNTLQDIPVSDIGKMNHIYMSWWSPGQWIFPGLLNYFFGVRLGIASICITILSLVVGFAGYFKVFKYFGFSPGISLLSLLIIFSGSNLYYCFIIYQGGEILEFACFPWFLLYVVRLREISVKNIIGTTILFFICFIAKTTLLVYCTTILIAKVFLLCKPSSDSRFRLAIKHLLIFLPGPILIILVTIFYLSRGPHPSLINHFIFSPEGFLISLSSALTSILSIQQWIERITKTAAGSLHGNQTANYLYYGFYLAVILIQIWIMRLTLVSQTITRSYKAYFFILFTGVSAFFIFAYSFNTNIDFSSRHFKLMGYLFVPGLVSILYERIRHVRIQVAVLVLCLICMADVFYLKEKWIKNRYISVHYFYRNCEPLPYQDKLDKKSYYELLRFDQKITNDSVIFFIESSADIAIDIHHPFILQTPGKNIHEKIYRGNGPRLFASISKSSYSGDPGILRLKFPDYKDLRLVSETEDYLFFLSDKGN
jgi:hypothetical protein